MSAGLENKEVIRCAIQRNNGLSIAKNAKARGDISAVRYGVSYARRWQKKLMVAKVA